MCRARIKKSSRTSINGTISKKNPKQWSVWVSKVLQFTMIGYQIDLKFQLKIKAAIQIKASASIKQENPLFVKHRISNAILIPEIKAWSIEKHNTTLKRQKVQIQVVTKVDLILLSIKLCLVLNIPFPLQETLDLKLLRRSNFKLAHTQEYLPIRYRCNFLNTLQ